MSKLPEALYDYIFHYNIYTGYWNCFLRSDSKKYFNGELKDCIKARDVNDIIKHFMIIETNQDKKADNGEVYY